MGKTPMRVDRLPPRQIGFATQQQPNAAGSSSSSSANMANEFFPHGAGNGGDAFSTFWPAIDNGHHDGFGLSGSENGGGPFTPSQFTGGGGGGDVAGSDLQFPTMMQAAPMGHHQFIPLRCTECGIAKPGCEELEVHIKVEHLNWLPFVCPVCNGERASDSQMREHLHSAHRKGNSNRYIYLDNPKAKHTLQVLLDRALYGYVSRLREQNSSSAPSAPSSSYNSASDRFTSLLQGTNSVVRNKRFSNLNGSNLDNGLNVEDLVDIDPNTNITEGHGGLDTGLLHDEELDDETNLQLNTIFGGGASGQVPKADFDFDQGAGNLDLSGVDQSDLLGNVAALFSSTASEKSNSVTRSSFQPTPRRRGANKINQKTSTAKKRVLGLCSRCQKPVTAGARQMHMYFHLSKDSNTYRFRCKFPGCTVEHYRKDQMENHMVKVHGRIEPNLIEDRTTELFELCQKLSMETLGTTGNNPGPTAAEAQAIYDQQQEDFQEDRRVNKRKSQPSHQPYEPSTSKIVKTSFEDMSSGGAGDGDASKLGDDQMIECKLCKKSLLNRIRGFHILWHMARDLGINRYACKHCSYGHDRSQSVQRHGKLEHGDDNCCEDTINYHHQEIKEMSQTCFGIDALFAHDSRRPKKFPMQVRVGVLGELELQDDADSVLTDERNESLKEEDEEEQEFQQQDQRKVLPLKISTSALKVKTEPPSTPVQHKEKENPHSSSGGSSKSKKPAMYKIFGRRKPTSRTKTKHVAKLRELSVKLGGALYYKRKMNEVAHCEICGKIPSRMSEHVTIEHMEGYELWLCPQCGIGHNSREFLCRHIRDAHESTQTPIDNRFKWAQEVKEFIKKCYPAFFVNTPLPSAAEIRKLKNELQLDEEIDLGDESEEGDAPQQEEQEGGVDDEEEEGDEEETSEFQHAEENDNEHEYDEGHSEETSENGGKKHEEQDEGMEEDEDEEEEEDEDDVDIEGEDDGAAENREQEEGSEEPEGEEHDMDDSASGSGSGESNEDEEAVE